MYTVILKRYNRKKYKISSSEFQLSLKFYFRKSIITLNYHTAVRDLLCLNIYTTIT